tara:strand:+ start:2910 stop:3296 length:387 start_codon:yes stop_codon:yes gene_type:complete
MTDVATALGALGITEWVMRGEPTNETEFNSMFAKVTGEDGNGSAIESSNPADFGVTWSQVDTKKTELVNAEPLKLLRAERDSRLAATDWWGLSDLTMTSDQTTYRQALRDITGTYNSLDTVVWPTKPS